MRRFADKFPPASVVDGTARASERAEVRLLSTSFRNTGRVLDVAAAIQRGRGRVAQEVRRLSGPPQRANRGAVVCALLPTSTDEARWVAEQVAGLLRLPGGLAPDGQPWPDGRQDSVRPSDIAVLCRKRSQFSALRTALEAEGIPVEVVGLGGLLTVPEVADIVATLRVLHSPAASDSLIRTLTSARWRVGPQDLVAIGARARGLARDQTGAAGERPSASPVATGQDHLTTAVTDLTHAPPT